MSIVVNDLLGTVSILSPAGQADIVQVERGILRTQGAGQIDTIQIDSLDVTIQAGDLADSVVVVTADSAPDSAINIVSEGPQGPKGDPGQASESSPAFTYADGRLARVDYASGNRREMAYDGARRLAHVDYVQGATTRRRTLSYSVDGSLASVSEAVI